MLELVILDYDGYLWLKICYLGCILVELQIHILGQLGQLGHN